MNKNLKLLADEKIYPIIRESNPEKAKQIAEALIAGGIKIMEINVENAQMYDVITDVSRESVVCAGSIITSWQANKAFESGAKMFSSPIFQLNMVKISKNIGIPFIAGATTANEAYNAWKARIPLIKIFPTTAMGGVQYIEDILRQMPFLNVLPMGNIKCEETKNYIKAGARVVGIGRDLCHKSDLSEVTSNAKKLIETIKTL